MKNNGFEIKFVHETVFLNWLANYIPHIPTQRRGYMQRQWRPQPGLGENSFDRSVFCSVMLALAKDFTRTVSLVDFDLSACMSR